MFPDKIEFPEWMLEKGREQAAIFEGRTPKSQVHTMGDLSFCPLCNTPNQRDFPYPDGSVKRISCLCECKKKERDELEEKKREKERMARIERLRAKGISDPTYREWQFKSDDGENKKISDACRKYVDEWELIKKYNHGLLLYGPVGTGKTFYACCIANALIDLRVPTLVTSFPRLLNRLQAAGFGEDKNALVDSLTEYDMIVIDDLGAERKTEYALEQIFNIIDIRYRSGKPMIVTTNLSPKDIKNPDTIAYERILDRIVENCAPILIDGPSRRIQKAERKRAELAKLIGL